MRLYEIPTQMQKVQEYYNQRLAELENELAAGKIDADDHTKLTDELIDAVGALLDGLDGDLTTKLDNIARLVTNALAESDIAEAKAAPFQAEAKRYTTQAKQAKALAERCKEYAKHQLIRADKQKVQTPDFTLRRQINGQPSIICMDLASIPAEYRIPQPDKVDNEAIKEAWKAAGKPGEEGQGKPGEKIAKLDDVPGVEIRRGQHLRIV